ncbi:hypothetical protein DW187_07360 [Ruminococcus sp. AM16-34]|nr:hypothetical protein [Mediterraneibacter faecis]RGF11323.1 hypothetical protein DW187_07360 [Ruminococcus sp. AM16-34]RGF99792.1 hypothetical protein DW977_11250 [Ruminococcus sp. AM49-10BH]RGG55803.1 hypothetical protein DWX54_08425 [Ruminococcus sp. AF19-4LB]RGH69725.1 hypothetical protein DW772_08605 [Ruminococcus sp. AM29-5AC]RGH73245.1 hypothetical protein DW764_08080 [Ruminococcus sp. AM29-1LB]RGH77425.1 hypothetical protein DW762_08215 [Ruminococcus sp. AM29-19LB]RGH81892.1 hypothe
MHNSRVYRLAFSERKMPHDTVNVADFAALECKAAVKSVAVCAMREKQQNLWGRDKNVSALCTKREAV